MSLLLALAMAAEPAAPAAPPAAMPAAFLGEWAPTSGACGDKYARRIVTASMNTEGDYWGVVKVVETLGDRHILVRESDDDFGVALTADYVLSPDSRMLVLHVLERNGAKVSEAAIPMVRCEVARG
ncbi:hypothetical protein [Novosphingobium sp.]|uniref:hypothetical protein n=1 Tax=Novosphingobium sp. TaxID=1874826 RepID=UPI003BAB14E9